MRNGAGTELSSWKGADGESGGHLSYTIDCKQAFELVFSHVHLPMIQSSPTLHLLSFQKPFHLDIWHDMGINESIIYADFNYNFTEKREHLSCNYFYF